MSKQVQTPFLLILSAPSGGGKTTLCSRLLEDFPRELSLSISSTTRPPRQGEKNGREYFFLSHEEFEQKIHQGDFAEWAQVHQHYYGTSKSTLQHNLEQNISVVLDIDVQGAASLRKTFPQKTYSVFISPPSDEVLEERLRNRGTDAPEVIESRIIEAKKEMKRAKEFDQVIINDDLNQAYQELKKSVECLLGYK